jgi:hypothetical protein
VVLARLRTALTDAQRRRIVAGDFNAARLAEMPSSNSQKRKRQAPTLEDVDRLLGVLDGERIDPIVRILWSQPVDAEVLERWADDAVRVPQAILDETLTTTLHTSFIERLNKMPPTLVVGGLHDAIFTPDILRRGCGCDTWRAAGAAGLQPRDPDGAPPRAGGIIGSIPGRAAPGLNHSEVVCERRPAVGHGCRRSDCVESSGGDYGVQTEWTPSRAASARASRALTNQMSRGHAK